MAKQKKKKEVVFLVCEETGDRNYTITGILDSPQFDIICHPQ